MRLLDAPIHQKAPDQNVVYWSTRHHCSVLKYTAMHCLKLANVPYVVSTVIPLASRVKNPASSVLSCILTGSQSWSKRFETPLKFKIRVGHYSLNFSDLVLDSNFHLGLACSCTHSDRYSQCCRFGAIPALTSTKAIKKGEEILNNYNIDVWTTTLPWYKDTYMKEIHEKAIRTIHFK